MQLLKTVLALAALLAARAEILEVEGDAGGEQPLPEEDNPLLYAAMNGDVDGVLRELDANPDEVNIANDNGWTPLIWSIDQGHVDMFDALLDRGADVNLAENDGWPPLMFAAFHGDEHMVQRLLELEGDVLFQNQEGDMAHQVAAHRDHKFVSEMIANSGVHHAVALGDVGLMMDFVRDGAWVNTQSGSGWTPLIFAVAEGKYEEVEDLLNRGADADQTELDGWTPLMFAANNNFGTIVRLLLDRGADTHKITHDGRTALNMARDAGHQDVIEILAVYHGENPGSAQYGLPQVYSLSDGPIGGAPASAGDAISDAQREALAKLDKTDEEKDAEAEKKDGEKKKPWSIFG